MPQPNPLGAQVGDEPAARDPVRTFTVVKLLPVRSEPHSGHGTVASLVYADMDIRRSKLEPQS